MAKLIEITGKAISGEWGTDDETGDGTPVLRTTNFTNHGVVDFTNVVTRNLGRKDLSGKFLRHGDIIIEKSGGSDTQPVGRVIFYDGPENTYLFNNFTGLLRVRDQQHWVPRYVFYALFANYRFGGTKPFENRTTGLHNLQTESYVAKTEIRETDVDSQIAICAMLDRLKAIIESRQLQLRTLDTLIKARFVEMFGTVYDERFPKCKLRELAHIKHGFAFSGEFFSEIDNGIVLVTPGNFAIGGGFQETKNRYFTSEYPQEYVLHAGDLIVTMTDLSKKADTLGYGAIVPSTGKIYLHNQRIGLFDKLDQKLDPIFMRWFMQTSEYREEIVRTSTGSTVHHTSPDRILDSIIFIPPIGEQIKFRQFAEQTDKSKAVVQAALDKAQLLFNSLMQQYFG